MASSKPIFSSRPRANSGMVLKKAKISGDVACTAITHEAEQASAAQISIPTPVISVVANRRATSW